MGLMNAEIQKCLDEANWTKFAKDFPDTNVTLLVKDHEGNHCIAVLLNGDKKLELIQITSWPIGFPNEWCLIDTMEFEDLNGIVSDYFYMEDSPHTLIKISSLYDASDLNFNIGNFDE